MTVTAEQVAEWRRLAEVANFGHLEARLCWPAEDGEPDYCDVQIIDIYADATIATSCYSEDMPLEVSEYIAAACNAVPALCAEVERLTAQVAALTQERDVMSETILGEMIAINKQLLQHVAALTRERDDAPKG